MYRYNKAFCEMMNEDAMLQQKLNKLLTYKMLNMPLPMGVFMNKKLVLMKLKSKNDMHIKKAQMLTEDISTLKWYTYIW